MLVAADPPIVEADDRGVLRVAGSRVTFDVVITEYLDGLPAEQIAEDFPAISLADVHATIAHYLRHRDELDRYLTIRREQAEEAERRARRTQPIGLLRRRLEERLRTNKG